MSKFLKIALLVVIALVALKFLPLTLALVCGLGLVIAGLAVVGCSLLAVGLVAALLAAAVLAPVWIPVVVIGLLIGLARRRLPRPGAA